MSVFSGPEIVNDGLVLQLDAANPRSYPGTGTKWINLSDNQPGTIISNTAVYSSSGWITFNDNSTSSFICNVGCSKTTYSVEWTFYPTLLADYNLSIGFGGWGNFTWHTGSAGQFWTGTDVATRINNFGAGTVTINSWQTWTVTFNSGTCVVYKNGSLIISQSGMNISASPSFTTFGAFWMNGRFANAKVYSKVLTLAEIRQNFEATRSRYGI